jgi:hypothetical protein
MAMRGVGARGLAASLMLAALAIGVFYARALPLPTPPLYGGNAHPWVATFLMAGLLAGAVFFRSPWMQAYAWSTAVAFLVFEAGSAFSRMPAVYDLSFPRSFRPWTRSLELALAIGAVVFLLSLPYLLAGPRKDVEER